MVKTRPSRPATRELQFLASDAPAADALAGFFRVFGDATRLRILARLSLSPLKVGDLARELGISQSAASHQLRTLKDSRLVRARKEGQTVSYAPDDDHIRTILADGYAHVSELAWLRGTT